MVPGLTIKLNNDFKELCQFPDSEDGIDTNYLELNKKVDLLLSNFSDFDDKNERK